MCETLFFRHHKRRSLVQATHSPYNLLNVCQERERHLVLAQLARIYPAIMSCIVTPSTVCFPAFPEFTTTQHIQIISAMFSRYWRAARVWLARRMQIFLFMEGQVCGIATSMPASLYNLQSLCKLPSTILKLICEAFSCMKEIYSCEVTRVISPFILQHSS